MIGEVLHNRYHIESQLGEGGIGIVYRARDTVLERDVAVKILSPQSLGTEGQARLLQEARAVAKLNHPNIVTVYDVGEYQEASFIVMELVSGQSLEHAKSATADDVIALALQLCDALDHAHAQGIIHRDIKPANVMVADDGTAKLMDFGIARSPTSQLTQEGAIVGTISYIAPEQAMGQELDGRADLYALGVMLYELTTGKLPFEADDPLAVITQHLHAPVVPPRAKNHAIPPGLDALIVQLMGKRPQDRPASAAEVRAALESLGSDETTLTPDLAAHKELSMLDRIVRGQMVGRKRELEEARTFWRRARHGEGQVLLISGEPGIGKTRLVREIATLVEVSAGMVLTGECYAEGSAPYAPVAQMIREALSHAPDLDLPDLVLGDLITLAPDLRARYPDVPSNPPLDPAAEQQRLFESVVAFFVALSAQAPLLLFLDDVHWADSGTLYLMRYLARRLQENASLLIATYREVELGESHPFQYVLLDLSRARIANRLKLSRLGREETETMLEALFVEAIAPDFLDGIYRETEGNPFFIEEVCKGLVESGRLYFEDGVWQRPSMDQLEIPQSVRAAIQSRIAGLSTAAQDALQWAAIIGREFDFELLLETGAMDEDGLIDALEEAQKAQLIEEARASVGERLTFVHTLIRATLHDNLSSLRRSRAHRQVAAVIERLHPDDYGALAYHCGEAGDDARALSYLTQAAHRARRVYANEDAMRYYGEALDIIPTDHPERFDLLAARAGVLDLLGRRDEQLADIEEMGSLAERERDQGRQVDALIALIDHNLAKEAFFALPRTGEFAERANAIAEQLGDPVRKAQAARRIGITARRRRQYHKGREWLEEAGTLFKEHGYLGEAAACWNDLREVLGLLGDYREAQRLSEEALALSREAGDRRQESISLRSLAYSHLYQNEPDQALPLAEAALVLNQQIGDIAEGISTTQSLGLILFELGQHDKALSDLRQALEMAETFGFDRIGWSVALNVLDLDYRLQGKYQSGLAFLDERLAVVEDAEEKTYNKTLFVMYNYHRMVLYEYTGMVAEALRIANKFLPVAQELQDQVPRLCSWIDRLKAELGQPEAALRSLEVSLEHEASNFHVLFNAAYVAWLSRNPEDWPAGLERARAAVEILQGFGELFYNQLTFALDMTARLFLALNQPEEALRYAQEAIQLLPVAPEIYGREQFYFTYSRALRATGQHRDADEALRRAFESLMRIADQTKDKVLRKSLLENVPYNREMVTEATERGVFV
jgi:tetratricopeptide (TPR) repeat protein/predicted Ser/Thr protein kinase